MEDQHRVRLERRMRELGVTVPDRESVRIGPWLRLQARVAPVDRLLAAREAAEQDDVDAVYAPSTGDAATDALFRQIREEERSHATAIVRMRQRSEDSNGGAGTGAAAVAAPEARERLDRILGRERWHQRGSGWIADAITAPTTGWRPRSGPGALISGFWSQVATSRGRILVTAPRRLHQPSL